MAERATAHEKCVAMVTAVVAEVQTISTIHKARVGHTKFRVQPIFGVLPAAEVGHVWITYSDNVSESSAGPHGYPDFLRDVSQQLAERFHSHLSANFPLTLALAKESITWGERWGRNSSHFSVSQIPRAHVAHRAQTIRETLSLPTVLTALVSSFEDTAPRCFMHVHMKDERKTRKIRIRKQFNE